MAIQLRPPRTPAHAGVVVKTSGVKIALPEGSDYQLSPDRRLIFAMVPSKLPSGRRTLHVFHASTGQEVFGVEPRLLARIRSEVFGLT